MPPSHVKGTAVTTSAIGYQFGPRVPTEIAVIAPASAAASPTNARIQTCRIGACGANRAVT